MDYGTSSHTEYARIYHYAVSCIDDYVYIEKCISTAFDKRTESIYFCKQEQIDQPGAKGIFE